MSGVRFDKTFNLGHLFQAAALLVGGVLAYANLNNRVSAIEGLTAGYTSLATRVAVLETRTANMEATLERIYAQAQETNGRLTQLQVDLTGVAARLRQNGTGEPAPF